MHKWAMTVCQVLFSLPLFNIISGLVIGSNHSALGCAELLLLVITPNPPNFRQWERCSVQWGLDGDHL